MSTEGRLERLGLAHLINLPLEEREKELQKFLEKKRAEADARDAQYEAGHPEWKVKHAFMQILSRERIRKAEAKKKVLEYLNSRPDKTPLTTLGFRVVSVEELIDEIEKGTTLGLDFVERYYREL